MKQKIILLAVLTTVTLLLSGCCLSHEWQDAICDALSICVKCEKTTGVAFARKWNISIAK